MPTDQRPRFPTYLLPSITLPFRRRYSSTSSTSSASSSSSASAGLSQHSSQTTPTGTPPNPAYLDTSLQEHAKTKHHSRPPRLHLLYPSTLKCSTCSTDIAYVSQIVSKGFTGRHGRAFLVSGPPSISPCSPNFNTKKEERQTLINTTIGKNVNRDLLTGQHVVADISCKICTTVLGWKYVDAREPGQRYKIGKFILERGRCVSVVGWGDDSGEEPGDCQEDKASAQSTHGTSGDAMREHNGSDIEPGTKKTGKRRDEVIEFDSEDEDECEDLFAGVWDPDIVGKRRSRRIGNRRS